MHCPKVSVIIPAYNAEAWIDRCINSVLSQTVADLELIIVNDGSKDRTFQIAKRYEVDARVRVFDKPNGGVSSARNVGLDNANGEWITFIDADDWVESNMFDSYLRNEFPGINLLFGGHINHYADGRMEQKRLPSVNIDKDNFDCYYSEFDFHWRTSPWAKFYRKSTIDALGLRFDSRMKIGEDALFLYKFMLFERRFRLVDACGYNYNFEVSSSLTKKGYEYSEEIYFYNNIKAMVSALQETFLLKSKESLSKLDWLLGYYLGRVLNSLYISSGLSMRQRVGIIKHLELTPLINSLYVRGVKERLLFFLLKNRNYKLYDLVRIIKKTFL